MFEVFRLGGDSHALSRPFGLYRSTTAVAMVGKLMTFLN